MLLEIGPPIFASVSSGLFALRCLVTHYGVVNHGGACHANDKNKNTRNKNARKNQQPVARIANKQPRIQAASTWNKSGHAPRRGGPAYRDDQMPALFDPDRPKRQRKKKK